MINFSKKNNDTPVKIDLEKFKTPKYFPVEGNYDIIKCTDNLHFETVLDVGFGKGGASVYFANRGKKVTAIGKTLNNFDYPKDIFDAYGVETTECWVEHFDPQEKYGAIWASHILEHTANVSLALQKFRTLLHDDGWLLLSVPPHKTNVVTGHISMGWSVVQLMLILYFNGFNVKKGHFASHKYNITAFVQKSKDPKYSPSDGGIVSFDDIKCDFPIDLAFNMDGQIPSVNWFTEVDHKPMVVSKRHLDKAIVTIAGLRKEIAFLEAKINKLNKQASEING